MNSQYCSVIQDIAIPPAAVSISAWSHFALKHQAASENNKSGVLEAFLPSRCSPRSSAWYCLHWIRVHGDDNNACFTYGLPNLATNVINRSDPASKCQCRNHLIENGRLHEAKISSSAWTLTRCRCRADRVQATKTCALRLRF